MDEETAWRVIESRAEYDTVAFTTGYDEVVTPDDTTRKYYWASLSPAAVVVPVIGDEVVLIEQYRPPAGEYHTELPAGIVEEGESYVEAARRELREETGYVANDLELVEEYTMATGILRHERGVVIARDLECGEQDLGENEYIEVKRVPADRVVSIAREQPVNDVMLTGVLLAREEGVL